MKIEYMDNWDTYFFNIIDVVKKKSKDPHTKVGCVIVGLDKEIRTTGFNGFCRGVFELDPSRWERPEKYFWVEHAERNAIYNAARVGINLINCIAYVQILPCVECAKALIQSGIKVVKVSKSEYEKREENLKVLHGENYEKCVFNDKKILQMFSEAGVELLLMEENTEQ